MDELKGVYHNVYIRSVDYLNSKDAALVGSFLAHSKNEVPIYYQFCQPKNPNAPIDEVDKVGYATNFKIFNDDVVCDVYLNHLSAMAHQFTGTIDNYTVNVKEVDGELKLLLTRFIIYNKSFKEQRLKEIANAQMK